MVKWEIYESKKYWKTQKNMTIARSVVSCGINTQLQFWFYNLFGNYIQTQMLQTNVIVFNVSNITRKEVQGIYYFCIVTFLICGFYLQSKKMDVRNFPDLPDIIFKGYR